MTLYENNKHVCAAEQLRENLDAVRSEAPDYRLVEVDMDPAVYEDWHIPGAVSIDWQEDIIDGLGGNVISADTAESLFGELGIAEETTVVVYGDRANWFAGHAYWVLKYYGHDDVQLLDGGRRHWQLEGYETTTEEPAYPSQEYSIEDSDESIRACKQEVEAATETETPIVDVRNPQEYRGEKPPAEIPNTTEREGHIPTADNVPWGEAVNADGTFRSPEELRDIYGEYLDEEGATVTYCRIGERSSITWFVISELLDAEAVNYDGSWTEWAADQDAPVQAPIKEGGED